MYALLVVAPWMISPSVRAGEMSVRGQVGDAQIAPSTEIKNERTDKSSSGLLDNVVVSELTKDVERPMSLRDPRPEMITLNRRPLYGPWKNAFNDYHCVEG
jgi:hypothetical protein